MPAQRGPEAVLSSLAPLCASSDQDRHKLLASWLRGEGWAGQPWATLGFCHSPSLSWWRCRCPIKPMTGLWFAATGTPKARALPHCHATRKLSHPADDPSSNPPGLVLVPLAPVRAATWQPDCGFLRSSDGPRPQAPCHQRFDCVGRRRAALPDWLAWCTGPAHHQERTRRQRPLPAGRPQMQNLEQGWGYDACSLARSRQPSQAPLTRSRTAVLLQKLGCWPTCPLANLSPTAMAH